MLGILCLVNSTTISVLPSPSPLLYVNNYFYLSQINSSKRNPSTSQHDKIGYKHVHSTFLSKITFWWITPLLWQGYHQPLELEDLGILPEDDSSRSHYDQFLIIYQNLRVKFSKKHIRIYIIKEF